MRKAGRIDIIQQDAVKLIRQIGASVQVLSGVGHGVPDLLVGYHGVNILVELKTGPAGLTKDEETWHSKWAGQVVIARTPEEAQLAIAKSIPRRSNNMPMRILRDGILGSVPVNSLSDSGEILYRRLMSVVDDYGRFEALPAILRARLFPLKLAEWPEDRVATCLRECSSVEISEGVPLVSLYSSGGKGFLQINNFDQRTRSHSKFPNPGLSVPISVVRVEITAPRASADKCAHLRTTNDSLTKPASIPSPSTSPYTSPNDWDAETAFGQLWEAYPQKGRVQRPLSQQYYLDHVRSAETAAEVVAAVTGKWAKSEVWGKGFVMALPRWLDQERWKEDPEPVGGKSSGGQQYNAWKPPVAEPESE